MKAASETTLTPLDLCVLIAHDAVSLLSTDAEAMNAALQLRTGLERYAAASELSRDAILLLMWIDRGYRPDALTDFLETVRQRCRFSAWYLGHYHREMALEQKYFPRWERISEIG